MRFGVILGQYVSDPVQSSFSQLVERAKLAEELGFDLLCLGDRRVYAEGFHELLTTMTALAVLTSRIQICSSGFILPIYHPVLLAEQMAHLDVLSQGRLIFGVVLGYRDKELGLSEVASRERAPRLEESLEIISRLWAGECLTFEGAYHRCREVQIAPLPLQKPRPPIWIGGTARPAVRRAARLADGWIASASMGRDEFEQTERVYREALKEQEKEGVLVLPRSGFVAESGSRARSLVEEPLLRQYERYVGWMKDTPEGKRYQLQDLDAFQERLILGSPEECIDQLAAYQEMGIDTFLFHCQHEGVPNQEILSCMELFASRVMPAFRTS